MVWTPNHWERDCRKKRAGELRKLPAPEANVTSKREKPSPSVLLTLRRCHKADKCIACSCNILRDGRLLAQADLVHNLYALRTRDQCRSEVHNVRTIRINSESLTDLWHKRLGHPSMKKMCNILKSDRYREKLTGLIPSGMTCEPCIMAKHHKIGFPKATTSRATATLQLVDWCAIVVCNSGVQWRRTRQTLLLGKTCRSFYG